MRSIFPVLGILAGLCFASLAFAKAGDWPQWRGPARDGVSSEHGLLTTWPEGGPPRRWLFRDCGVGYSSPVIVDGRLYTMGARDGVSYLLALDAENGRELWSAEIGPALENDWGDGPRSTPAVDGNRIYALSGTGTLVAVRLTDGRELWRVSMLDFGGAVPFWGYSESVLVDGDLVLVTPGGEEGAIVALEKDTGELRWQAAEVTDEAHYSSIIRAELHGRPQYVQLLMSQLVGIAPEDGRLLWQVDWPGRVAVVPTPIVHEDRVYVSSGYGVGCMLVEVDPDNVATQVYESKAMKQMKNHHGGVIRVGDYVYGYSDSVGWLCQDFASGDRAWRERGALGKGAIGYADGKLYCLGEDDGEVVLVDASPDGWQERGRFTLSPQTEIRAERGKVWTHPVIVGGRLYLRDQDLLYCYDVKE